MAFVPILEFDLGAVLSLQLQLFVTPLQLFSIIGIEISSYEVIEKVWDAMESLKL